MRRRESRSEPIGVRIVVIAAVILMLSATRRWNWLTDAWYPTRWARGWLALAGILLAALAGILHLEYRDAPFTDSGPTDDSP